jgi:hypothetical protein
VLATLSGQRGTAGNPTTALTTLLMSVWLPLALAFTLVWLATGRRLAADRADWQVASTFMLIGLAGTLPIMISPRQTPHYVMPATPFFAIGVAALARSTARELVRKADQSGTRKVMVVAGVILAGAVTAARLPVLERDVTWLADLDKIAPVAPRNATVGICSNVNGDWLLHAWMQRRFAISLDASGRDRDWFLETNRAEPCPAPPCRPMSAAGRLVLLRCR